MSNVLRKTYRSQLTKLLNQANVLLSSDFDKQEGIVLISRIKSARQMLEQLSGELLHSGLSEELLEAECEKTVEYQDRAVEMIARLEYKAAAASGKGSTDDGSGGCDGAVAATPAGSDFGGSADDSGGAVGRAQTVAYTRVSVRLPKLELIKFNGDYNAWPAFWEQFQTAIHNNAELDEASKFTYLKSVLTGNAAITVQGLTSIHEKREGWKPHFCKTTHTQNPQRNTTHRHQPRNSDLFKFFRGRTPGLIAWAVAMNKPAKITKSLQTLGITAENYGLMVKSIILKSLPFTLRTEFNKRQVDFSGSFDDNESVRSDVSSRDISYEQQISQLLNFIRLKVDSVEQAKVLDGDSKNFKVSDASKKRDDSRNKVCTAAGLFTSVKETCLFCKSQNHNAADCNSDVTLARKRDILKTQKRCFRCTKANHNSRNCKVRVSCSLCSAKHATSMCDPDYRKNNKSATPNVTTSTSANNTPAQSSSSLLASGQINTVYLQTACSQIITKDAGQKSIIRMVLDGGSQLTFIKECVSRQLNLPIVGSHKISIMAFGNSERTPARVCRKVSLTLKSLHSNELKHITAIEVPHICFDNLDSPTLDDSSIYEFSTNFRFRVDETTNVAQAISLLVGADYYWKIVTGNTQKITSRLMGVESVFGWVLHGVSQGQSREHEFSVGLNIASVLCTEVEHNADAMDLKHFWTSNRSELVLTLNNITYRNERYQVSLPWKETDICLDSNYKGALCRLTNLTRKLVNSDKIIEYDNTMREYLNNECAERSPNQSVVNRTYFMPHRAVYRDDKDTTKMRIVFDASAHAPGLPSLNEVLEQGENLAPHLFHVLINFRLGAIAIIADIEKAFLQIEVDENDRDALSFLWYEEPIANVSQLSKVVNYRMKRVTFGVNCSPFLLAATLKKHLQSQTEIFKDTCEILLRSFYVDDLVVAVDNEKDAERIFCEAKQVLATASMNLRKWCSNNLKLRKIMDCKPTAKVEIRKVLGILWEPSDDVLMINLDPVLEKSQLQMVTKRIVLQTVSKIFDPLGFLSPFIVRAKIILQSVWKAKLQWDEPLPIELANEYRKIASLSDLTMPRNALSGNKPNVSLHIFADASPVAYGAVAYLRCERENGESQAKFLIAKARVSPINEKGDKQLTLPRLELTAAVCAARLQNFILSNATVTFISHTLWTDSKITLHWIKGKPSKWKPYVCHRVNEIQRLTKGDWRHCPGNENPADLLTRGVKAKVLVTSEMWQCGPDWLSLSHEFWPEGEAHDDFSNEVEASVFTVQNIESTVNEPIFHLEKCSSLEKVLRITAYVKRFIHNLKQKNNKLLLGLKSAELIEAEKYWIQSIQQRFFSHE
nr:unnamed protein product [Callosobruchus chinensis]